MSAADLFPADIAYGPPSIEVEDQSFEEVHRWSWTCTCCGRSGVADSEDSAEAAGRDHVWVWHRHEQVA